MTQSRLSLALDDGSLTLPTDGRIALFNPGAGVDLSALPQDRLQAIQGFKPDHEALAARGVDTQVAADGPYAASVVYIPRAKAEARMMLAQAVAQTPGGLIVVDGQKTDGIDSLLRDCRKRVTLDGSLAKAHGKLFWFTAAPEFGDWASPAHQSPAGFVTVPGVFSADKVDRGSAALAAALPARLPGVVADLGAGWGYLSRAILERDGVEALHLVEAEHAALDCVRQNVTDPRARFHWADATRFSPADAVDIVVTNPPFHTGRAADPSLGRAFIAAAAAMLKPHGQLWLVANRHLPYEQALSAAFHKVEESAGDAAFKILHATAPLRQSRRGR